MHYIFKHTATYHRQRVSGANSGGRGGGVRCILGAQVQSGWRWGGNCSLQCLNLTVGEDKIKKKVGNKRYFLIFTEQVHDKKSSFAVAFCNVMRQWVEFLVPLYGLLWF